MRQTIWRTAILTIALTILTSSGLAAGQPVLATSSKNADARARALFFDARARASTGDHLAAVQLIDRAIKLLGERKRRMMPVLITALFELKQYSRARSEARTYLTMTPVIKSAEHKRIAALVPEFERRAADQTRRQQAETRRLQEQKLRADNSAWLQATRSNTTHSYRYYVQRYPHGQHIAKARSHLDAAKRREDAAQLARQRQQKLQREKAARSRNDYQLRSAYVRKLRKDAGAIKSSASLYYSTGILAIIGGGIAAVLFEDDTTRAIGAVGIAGGAVLLYLGQSRVNKARVMTKDADDIKSKRKPLPPNAGVLVSPWIGAKRSYGIALGGRF